MPLLNRNDSHHPDTTPQDGGRRYWRSLEELEKTPQFEELLQREFPQGASEMLSPFSRRAFLNLMGASVAFAGALTGCRRPRELVMPYAQQPEDLIPGIAQRYATSVERGGQVIGLLVEAHEGRPTKIEGLPEHPVNMGSADGITQALILELYDPDRSMWPLRGDVRASTQEFSAFFDQLSAEARQSGGEGLAILMQSTSSPSLIDLRRRVAAALPRATWHVWEPINEDRAREGARLAFGRPVVAQYDFEKADVVVSLDADFLASGRDHLRNARLWARRRRREGGHAAINKLFVAESNFSLTGVRADRRLRLPSSQAPLLLLALARALADAGVVPTTDVPQAIVPAVDAIDPAWVAEAAADLAGHLGRALIVAGPNLPPAAQAYVHLLNAVLAGDCAAYYEPADAEAPLAGESIRELAEAMHAGRVSSLVMLGGNPVYDAPADLDFAGALERVPVKVHFSLHVNETTALCTWHHPRAHFLESWGDLRATDGTISMVQPLIAPLYDGRTDSEVLARLAGIEGSAYSLLRSFHQGGRSDEAFDNTWRTILHDGLVAGSASSPLVLQPVGSAVVQAFAALEVQPVPTREALEVVFIEDPNIFDGRYANNGWLQETPDPVSRVTWDNCAYMNLETARQLGVKFEDVVRLSVDGHEVELPVWIIPGLADWTVVLHLGYGRRRAGRVGDGVGVDVYPLRRLAALHFATGARLTATGRRYPIACVQDHWAMEGRDLARIQDAPVTGDAAHATDDHHDGEAGHGDEEHGGGEHAALPLWKEHDYSERPQWAMVIDLNSCIGCNACMVACQAENNIPIVGKKHVIEGREMHWLRIDRYFVSDPQLAAQNPEASFSSPGFAVDSAEMVFQPMPCQHCETAPCEQVCPVAATTHSPDGINEMTYNRCIGTRYCSNNCPYKVRRFNFFNYHKPNGHSPIYDNLNKGDMDLVHMASNPNVTVRSRGVMEKCTFCIQRINRVRRDAKGEGRPIRDGEVQTACQQTCPTQAITFGDMLDPESQVAARRGDPGNYTLLDQLYTKPRTSYLPKLRYPREESRV